MYDLCAYLKNSFLGGDFNAVTRISDRLGSDVKIMRKIMRMNGNISMD